MSTQRQLRRAKTRLRLHPFLPCIDLTPMRRRIARVEQAALRHDDVQQRIEPVVEQDLGVVDHDQVDPDEHLEHSLK